MKEPTLKIMNDHILVEFDEKPKLNEALNIVAPDRYLIQEADAPGEHDAYGVTTDRRTINPQVVTVIQGNETIPDGSRCFVHYGAFEVAKWYTPKQAIIPARMAFFKIDPIVPFEGNYLCEEVFLDGEKTDSGIYTTPYAEVKLPCNVKVLYVPDTNGISIDISRIDDNEYIDEIKKNMPICVGDEVITIDAAQYTLKYQDKKYIKLKESEIVAKVVDGEIIPIGKYILVEIVETESAELVAENDSKAFSKDFAIKNRLFVPGIDFNPTAPPKHVDVKILVIGSSINEKQLSAFVGDRLLIMRNQGVPLKNDRWIISVDSILWTYAD